MQNSSENTGVNHKYFNSFGLQIVEEGFRGEVWMLEDKKYNDGINLTSHIWKKQSPQPENDVLNGKETENSSTLFDALESTLLNESSSSSLDFI